MAKEERILAWHFARDDGCLGYKDGRTIIKGRILAVEGKLRMCHHGLHGSLRAIDALDYARGSLACRVEIWGDVQHGDHKLVGRYRKCLGLVDADRILHEFAIWCAECALRRVARTGGRVDPRSRQALRVKRRWLQGKATDEQLDAVWAAAWAAGSDAGWDPARAAARASRNRKLESMLLSAMGRKETTNG